LTPVWVIKYNLTPLPMQLMPFWIWLFLHITVSVLNTLPQRQGMLD